jgi:hypothetical protein
MKKRLRALGILWLAVILPAAARAEMQLHLDKGLIIGETPHATAQKAHA